MGTTVSTMRLLVVLPLLYSIANAAPQQRPSSLLQRSFFDNPSYGIVLNRLNFTGPQMEQLIEVTPFQLGTGINDFSMELMSKLLVDEENEVKNVVFSPFSVHVALSMLYYASPKDSDTHRQIAGALGLQVSESSRYLFNYLKLLHYYDQIRTRHNAQVKLANRILIKDDFTVKPDFLTVLMGFYLSAVDPFKSVSQAEQSVNDFVKFKTEGLIDQLITPGSLDSLTKLVLINVIYYKANWKHQFQKAETAPMAFNLLGGREKIFHIQGMNLKAKKLGIADVPGVAKILELPYENPEFNMYIGVPEENSLEALNKLASNFEYAKFADKLVPRKLPVQIPAFDASFSTELKGPLKAMGIKDMFDDLKADFRDMTEKRVGVSKVAHEAVVKIDEEGSEASAATAIVLGSRSGGVPDKPFLVDRPFVFMIHDRVHDIPLFVGRMINPSGQDNPGATLHHSSSDVTSSDSNLASAAFEQQAAPPAAASQEFFDYIINDPSYEEKHHDAAASSEVVETELASQELPPDCGEIGYEEAEDPESVSFPCKGRDTLPIEKHNKESERQRRVSLDAALNH